MELESALKLANHIVFTKTGKVLREPELALLEGTWLGLTYEQMAESSEYSINYLMRDVGPRLWRLLSDILREPISKTNIRSVLERSDHAALLALEMGKTSRDDHVSLKSLQPASPSITAVSSRKPSDRSTLDLISYDGVRTSPKSMLLHNRTKELTTLTQWIVQEACNLIGIWGISGVGKTVLMRTLFEQLVDQFDVVTWRSLYQVPSLQVLTKSLLESVANSLAEPQSSQNDLVSILLETLQKRPFLLVLDEIESILQSEQTVGRWKEGYENYGDFFRSISEGSYSGCVVVIGLEPPQEFARLESKVSTVRSMVLSGLSAESSEHLLESERLVRSPQWLTLIDYYRGHPAALKASAQLIRNLFGGSVDEFLKQQSFIFEDINALLEKSFGRLSSMEREILFWLASEGKPATLSEIQKRLPLLIYPAELLKVLDSLKQRSLLDLSVSEGSVYFTLQPVLRDYVVNQFIAQIRSAPMAQDWYSSWSLRSGRHLLNLTPDVTKIVNLNEWLHNHFGLDWEPVERLFISPARASNRLRSAFHLREERIIKRFKQIQLHATPKAIVVALLVAINQETDATVSICAQVQPGKEESVLPANLKLDLLDVSGKTLSEVISQEGDNFIQLPYFSGMSQEYFGIQLSFNEVSHTEKFMI